MKKLGRMKSVTVALLLAFAVGIPVALAQSSGTDQPGTQEQQAQGQRGQRGHRGERHGRGKPHAGLMSGRLLSRLNLSEAQQSQLKQLNQSFRERTQSLRQELHAKRQELRQAEQGATFNEALATQKLTEMAALNAKLMGERFKLRQELLAVLTPEQRTQFDQLREQFKHRRQEFKRGTGAGRSGQTE